MMPVLLAAAAWRELFAKFLYLSMLIGIIVIPTRLSKGDLKQGPRRAVFAYLILCGFYYGTLRVVLPRV